MNDIERLTQRFREYLVNEGLKYTRQRRVIAEVFFQHGSGHRSLNDLLTVAQQAHPSIGQATVYRTMKLMAECGVALEHKFADSKLSLYEPNFEDEHHDHLICVSCGTIVEFEDDAIERRQEEVARNHGFLVLNHRHEIYGECSDCVAAKASA